MSDNEDKNIENKSEKVKKEKPRRNIVRDVVIGGVAFATLAVGGGKFFKNIKERKENPIMIPQENITQKDTVELKGSVAFKYEVRNVETETIDGFPMMKHAENPQDPDLLLTSMSITYDDNWENPKEIAHYTPISPEDKNKKIEILNGGTDQYSEYDENGKLVRKGHMSIEYIIEESDTNEEIIYTMHGRMGGEKKTKGANDSIVQNKIKNSSRSY